MISLRSWCLLPAAALGFLFGLMVTPSHKRRDPNCAESAQVLLSGTTVKCQLGQRMEREAGTDVVVYRCTCP